MPRLQADGHLPVSALTSAGDDAATTKPGTLVPIAGSAPVALAVVTVDGARSAAFELHGAGLRKAVTDDIATRLAADLG